MSKIKKRDENSRSITTFVAASPNQGWGGKTT